MAIFSTNQNRHLYVVKSVGQNLATIGDIVAHVTGTCDNDKELHFLYKGADKDTVLKTDRIPLKNLDYVKGVSAKSMAVPMKAVKITLNSEVNGGSLIAGQDYVLRIVFRQFFGSGDDHTYIKEGVVHCTSAMVTTPSTFWNKMIASLKLNFAREIGATANTNPYLDFALANGGGITITEKPQGWSLGTDAQERVFFEVYPTVIYDGEEDVIWGTVEDATPTADEIDTTPVSGNAIGNGAKIADLEWFCMGERGDQYRNMGWPNVITTTYMVDPTKEYDVVELHFAFTDTGVNSYRSEKDITFVCEATITEGKYGHTIANNLIGAINNATGLTIDDIEDPEAEEESNP